MRRCQKRVNVIALILPPIAITNLEDIMTIMVNFYKTIGDYYFLVFDNL